MNPGRVRALLELCRASNLPTCWTNVLVGAALGAAGDGAIPWARVVGMGVAVSLLYVSGMALNDAIDAPRDRLERASRPIPAGRISRSTAFVLAGLTMAGGLAVVALVGPRAMLWAIALAGCIVLYDLLHKRLAASVVLMGACRGLVYPTVAAAMGSSFDVTVTGAIALVMTAYIVLLTALARREHITSAEAQPGRPTIRLAHLALAALPLVPAALVRPQPWAVVAAVLAILWLLRSSRLAWSRPPRLKAAVMGWLAGICLIDAWFLALLEQPLLAVVAGACFTLTALGHRYILGT